MPLLARPLLVALAVVAATACTAPEQGGTAAGSGPTRSAGAPAPQASASPAPTPSVPATASGAAGGTTDGTTTPPAPTRAVPAPLAPPPGPAVVRTTPSGRPAPGTLQVVDWRSRARADSACQDGRAGAVSYGDLDADGLDEAAVPVACGAGRPASEVLVYTGEPRAARLLGKALSREQQEQVHAVEFRERHLIVTTLAHSTDDRSGEPDTAVTTRWVVRSGVLERTDRWEDPAYVLETDEE